MPKAATPTKDDLSGLLASTGLDIPAALDLQGKCDAALAEWEDRTGWQPYLAPGNTSARLFDPPAGRGGSGRGGRSLYLGAGLLSLTSLAVGVVPDPSGNYTYGPGTSGTLLTPNLNFYLRPQNAAAKGLAFTEVEFLAPQRGIPQSISIVGVWGRVLTVPDDAWQAILQRAAALCVPELSLSVSGGYFERKIGDSLKRFGGAADSGPLAQQVCLWDNNFSRAVMNKKRVTA